MQQTSKAAEAAALSYLDVPLCLGPLLAIIAHAGRTRARARKQHAAESAVFLAITLSGQRQDASTFAH
jgi:hypothetical protein